MMKKNQLNRKKAILTHAHSSQSGSIADAVVIKDGNLYLVASPSGSIPLDPDHGLGLYLGDCRFLCGYELTIEGKIPTPMSANSARSFEVIFQLSNPDLTLRDGKSLPRQQLGIRLIRTLDSESNSLIDRIDFKNYSNASIRFQIELRFRSFFDDVFVVRGLIPAGRRRFRTPIRHGNSILFRHEGRDRVEREAHLVFDFEPSEFLEDGIRHWVEIPPQGEGELKLETRLYEKIEEGSPTIPGVELPGLGVSKSKRARGNEKRGERTPDQAPSTQTRFGSSSPVLNQVIDRSLRDLDMLRGTLQNDNYFAAGIPWFGTLFGRDSLITAYQFLPFGFDIAEQTLRLLAHLQGDREDRWRDEQPGKILHELRTGELARVGLIPHTPYFGSIDSTPLFLILLAEHAHWSGSLELFNELRPNVERALKWIDEFGDLDGDGLLEYASDSPAESGALINQGWKDSGNAIVDSKGHLAKAPIALVEAQAYVCRAKEAVAELFLRSGDSLRASILQNQADVLRAKLKEKFWLPEKGIYAMALQFDKSPLDVVSSNAGHVLWSGAAGEEEARSTVASLMVQEMFSGWGIRTLSTREVGYNPMGYHLGTVWPHDNSMIAEGFRRYGFDSEAMRIFVGIFEAATRFEHSRLPEVFTGFGRHEFDAPVRYPVACHPQAWAAGAMPHLLKTILGLEASGLDRKLRIVRPMLPLFVQRMELRGLRIGSASVDLGFERERGEILVEVLKKDGELEVEISGGGVSDRRDQGIRRLA